MKHLTGLVLVFLSLSAFSADTWNTYQWNRKNELAKNGKISRSPWFEWWYYKVVIPESGKSYFFVYGVVNPWDQDLTLKGTRAYVGMGDFSQRIQVEEKFSPSDFKASYSETLVEVNSNTASDRFFRGNLKNKFGTEFSWDVEIEKTWAYNPEGWLMGTGITDIEWYPAQAGAKCTGSIVSNGETVNFTDAPCYQDRNWGVHFPDWWAWIVSNQFEGHPESVLAVGGGKPKVLSNKTPIQGVSIGLKHLGKEHSFRINELQYVRTNISFGKWEVMAINKTHRIEIEAFAPKEKFMDLQFMTPMGEVFHDYETLTGKVTVKLFERVGLFFKPLPVITSNFAGIEFGSQKNFDQNFTQEMLNLLSVK